MAFSWQPLCAPLHPLARQILTLGRGELVVAQKLFWRSILQHIGSACCRMYGSCLNTRLRNSETLLIFKAICLISKKDGMCLHAANTCVYKYKQTLTNWDLFFSHKSSYLFILWNMCRCLWTHLSWIKDLTLDLKQSLLINFVNFKVPPKHFVY